MTAWLIERSVMAEQPGGKFARETQYYSPGHVLDAAKARFGWATDPLHAVRFCRKQDAEAVARATYPAAGVSEHIFEEAP